MNPKFQADIKELTRKLGSLDLDAFSREEAMQIRLESLMVIQDLHRRVEEFEQLLASGTKLSMAASQWLASGERGISSNTMFTRLTGVNAIRRDSRGYPHDPDDLRRCRLLLEQVPELRDRVSEMAEESPEWARLVARWDEVCALMDEETPKWRDREGTASRTYDRMKELLRPPAQPKV